MDYVDTYPNAYIWFHASDMILMIDTYDAYLAMTKPQSHIAWYYYLVNKPNATPNPEFNGVIIIECKTLKHVVASASETDTGWGDS